jgi:hypothetical protein
MKKEPGDGMANLGKGTMELQPEINDFSDRWV